MSDLLPWSRFLKRRLPHRSLEFVHGLKHRANIGVCCPPHAHESIEIVYHPVGRGVTRFSGGRTLPFAEGHAVVCGFREVHDQVMERPGEDFCVHLGIPEGEGKETPPRRGFRVGPLGDPALIAEIVSLARGEIGLAPADRAIFGFRATAVLLSLIRLAETGGSQEDLEEEGKNAERHVLLAERYIEAYFSQIRSLEEVADHVGISNGHLRHAFRARRKKSAVQHLRKVRVARAKELLDCSDLPLKQIAMMCGFRDEYYFSAVFRQLAGIPPGIYRHRPKRGGRPEIRSHALFPTIF